MLKNCFIFLYLVIFLGACKKENPTPVSNDCLLPKVQGLQSLNIGNNEFSIRWNDDKAQVVVAEKATLKEIANTMVEKSANALFPLYKATGLKPGTEYLVKASAICPLNGKISTNTDEITVKTIEDCILPAPQNFKATLVFSKIKLTWDSVPGAVQYYYEGIDSKDPNFKSYGTLNSNSFEINPAVSGLSTTYTLVAVCSSGVKSSNKATSNLSLAAVLSDEVVSKSKVNCHINACSIGSLGQPYYQSTNTGVFGTLPYVFDNLSTCESYYYKLVSDAYPTIYSDFTLTITNIGGQFKAYYKDGDCNNYKNSPKKINDGILEHRFADGAIFRAIFTPTNLGLLIPPKYSLYRK
jgi:hypothetical protein